jgi:hypothetical protein
LRPEEELASAEAALGGDDPDGPSQHLDEAGMTGGLADSVIARIVYGVMRGSRAAPGSW